MAFNKAKAMQEAEKLVAQRKSADAIKQFLLILDKDPTEVAILNTVGDLYFRENNKAEALKCFHRLADAFVKDGFTVKAIAILKKIVKIDPSTVDPILRMAELYVLQGLSREARDQYIQAIDFFKKKKQTDRAIETYQKLVALDPENRNIRGKFAEFAEQAGRKEEAALAYAEIAESALRAGDIAAADAALKKSSQVDPGSKSAQLLQARIAAGQKDFGRAISLLESDPSLKATPAGSQLLLEAYIATDRGDEAAKLVANAYQDKPSEYSPIGIFANLCLQYEKADLAAQTMGRISDQLIQNKLGVPLMDSLRQLWTRYPENTAILESVLSVAERTADELSAGEALGALANVSERAGDLPKAEMFLSKLVKREPNNEQIRTRLNMALEKQGKEIIEYTPASLSGVPVEIPEEVVAPPPPEAVDEQARVVKEALENSDLFSRYGLIDKAVAELEKVLVTYPDQADIHRRIFEVCQRNLPARAKQASEALARIQEAKGDMAAAGAVEQPAQAAGVVEAAPATSLPSLAGAPPVPPSTGVELDLSDVFTTPVEEPPPVAEASLSVEVPLDLSPSIEAPPVTPAALEHDFSSDLDAFATPSTSSEAPPTEVSTGESAAPAEITASQFNFEEARVEVDFYLGQGFVEEARASVATLEERFPGEPQLAMLRQLIEEKVAPASSAPAEVPEAIPIKEVATPAAQVPIEEPALPAPKPPPPVVEPPPATGGDLLGDLAGDLAAGLEGFGESGPASGKSSAPAPAGAEASNDISPLSGLLDELGESGSADSNQDDPETHYNLGVAFREMGLFDEAIGEFQKVVKGAKPGHYPENFLQSCTLLAASFIDKGMPQIAAKWYLRALETPKLNEESTLALLYDLGTAYEQAGDSRNALEKFSEVYSQNIDYRDVAEKIRTLQQKAR